MSDRRRPAVVDLALPCLLLLVVLAVTVALGSGGAPEGPSPLQVSDLPDLVPEPDGECRRGLEPEGRTAPDPLVIGTARVSSELVLSCPDRFDRRSVTYVGELVGDLLPRDGGSWVQVNDDEYALTHGPLPAHGALSGTNSGLSVWLPEELAERVQGLGRPGRRGDVVQLEGVILRSDPEDGGGLTLRARRMEILQATTELREPFDRGRGVFAGLTLLAALAAWLGRRRAAR